MSVAEDPSRILEVGFGFWGSKVLLTGIELNLMLDRLSIIIVRVKVSLPVAEASILSLPQQKLDVQI